MITDTRPGLTQEDKGSMNAVEIEEAMSQLTEQPFDAEEFPFAFLQAFGNKQTTIKRLRKRESNRSDLGGENQQYPYFRRRARRGDKDARRAEGQPGNRQSQREIRTGDGCGNLGGRGPNEGRTGCLRPCAAGVRLQSGATRNKPTKATR